MNLTLHTTTSTATSVGLAAPRHHRRGLRRGLQAAVLAVLLVVGAGTAAAAEGVHVDEAIAADVDVAALEQAVAEARDDGLDLRVAVLADEPDGGAEAEADRRAGARGSAALVITPTEVGAVGAGHSDRQVDRALDDAFDALESDGEAAAAAAFADGLETGDGLPFDLPGTGVIVLVVVAVILLSVVPRLLGRGRRRSYQSGMGGPRHHRYGRGRHRRGGLGGAAMGAALGSSRARSRSSGSRGGSSRSRGGSSRSRGGSSRRR
jgi:hypothetical protein